MNILFCSVPFRPSVGGIETVSALLAEQFERAGHDVVLVTQAPASVVDNDAYRIVRRPSPARLLRWHRWADVVFHNNISLRLAWPLLFVRRPWVVAHHTWLPQSGRGSFAASLKRLAIHAARNVAASSALARALPVDAAVVPNPYAHDLFRPVGGVARDLDMVFVGRLVSDKGVDVLLDALGLLHARQVPLRLTVIGDGPEASALRRHAALRGVEGAVRFVGARHGPELVQELHRHRLAIVPSVWEEPFGLVVLEALACGCVPVVTRRGGLPEAAGRCGVVVPGGDAASLANAIESLHREPSRRENLLAHADEHLAAHRAGAVAARYLDVLSHAQQRDRVVRPA